MQDAPDTRRLPRRSVLAGAVTLGLAAAATAAQSIAAPTAAAAEPRYTQNGWRFCVNCCELFLVSFAGSVCPRTRGPHQVAGWTFRLTYNLETGGTGEDSHTQANWRNCNRCAALFWAPGEWKACPLGGTHSYRPESGQFLLPFNLGQPPWTQNQWRFCLNCSVLFYNGYAYRGDTGLCPYRFLYGHFAAGYDFAIPVSAYT
ncbi:hypothetical protein GCM10009677_42120 [Sphaerisporangium rubeum]|uniref:Uncharacterized protein n=1 Tax=Sphaerisporangium rubeum TaxID=321317 RepID=A0A7X0IAD7_9ACTN|nr:hypothetical protein [Sphaerisporangium rubeum]MBB6471577.1 hypothetical protein [Sphaerisporangium rubeum]